jgi:LPXTG-site transpeptidase (sortase) family protein
MNTSDPQPISRRWVRRLGNLLFCLLALDTLLLLVYCWQYFTTAPVQGQLTSGLTALLPEKPADFPSSAAGGVPAAAAQPPPSGALTAPNGTLRGGSWVPLNEPITPTPTPLPTRVEGELIIPALAIAETPLPLVVRGGAWNLTGLGARVGWLETTGASPEEPRAMVFIGHISLRSPAGPGPFYNLRALQPGSEIIYQTPAARYTYHVEQIRAVKPTAIEALYPADPNKLLLVTCTGWDALSQTYQRRLLVTAGLVSKQERP